MRGQDSNERVKAALESKLSPGELSDEEHEAWAALFMEKMSNPGPREPAVFEERRRKGLGVGLDEDGNSIHGSDLGERVKAALDGLIAPSDLTGTGKIVATAGEIVRFEKDQEFERDSATDDTRVKTAVSWLEEATLVSREENRVRIFPSSLTVRTLDEAKQRLSDAEITQAHRKQLLAIVQHLILAPADEGVSTDQLCGVSGLTPGALTKAMANLESFGIARNDVAMTLFIHVGVAQSSSGRLTEAANLERDLIASMRELAPDADKETPIPLNLQETCQHLRDQDHADARPDVIDKLIRGIARDGKGQDGGTGNIRLRKISRKTMNVTRVRTWDVIAQTAEVRWQAAGILLKFLTGRLDKGARGKDLQVETTVGDLLAQLTQDAVLKSSGLRDMTKLLERSLLWMHEQGVLTLGKGLTVFRPAMTVFLNPKGGQFTQSDFLPLEEHYAEQTLQTHVMATYAETGLEKITDAERLSEDYFLLNKEQFMKRWMPGMAREVKRQTTSKSWTAIVEDLGNKVQQDIVADDRDQTNVLVLAGPGSGKTRVLVHRIAYLLRMKREDPRGILVLAYNRHAAAEIRVRLRALVGDDAAGVTISTCHSLAMKLVGASFAGVQAATEDFDNVIMEAVRQLNPEGLAKAEAEAQRESLIQGFRWILVDEYQDIGPEEYALISAVAGRSLEDAELKLSLFAVGDDDQNIYAFNGASVDFIRRFEEDYKARPSFLIENYRSTAHIIEAANQVISKAPERMKIDHQIKINQARLSQPSGGRLEGKDSVAHGRVQLLDVLPGAMPQAAAAIDELIRLSRLDPNWNWSRVAVISRDWKSLDAVRTYAEAQGLRVDMANEDLPNVWRLRETQRLVSGLREKQGALLGIQDILTVLNVQPRNKWVDLLAEGVAELARELGTKTMPVPDIIEWIADWSRDTRGEQRGLLLLTAHRAKGLEFDHVAILNGGWSRVSKEEDNEAPRRLFYVAMTRAQQSLTVLTSGAHPFLKTGSDSVLIRHVTPDLDETSLPATKYQMPALDIVDLSFAGRQRDAHEVHNAVRTANVGDTLSLVFQQPHWVLLDAQKRVVGRMAKSWKPPRGHVFASGQIGAIINWRKIDSGEEYAHYHRRDSWETILPELIFRHENAKASHSQPTPTAREDDQTDRVRDNPYRQTADPSAKALDISVPEPQEIDSPPELDLKALIRKSIDDTRSWEDLLAALKDKGIVLAAKGGGLVVKNASTSEEIGKISALGFKYVDLIRHYGEGFPDHPATWLVEKALNDNYVPKGPRPREARNRKRKSGDGDNFSLIED